MIISCTSLIILTVVFLIFIIRAFVEDKETLQKIQINSNACPVCLKLGGTDINSPEGFHQSVIETIKYENHYGQFADSKVKKLLTAARDQIIRGAIIGALDGSPMGALQGALTWSMTGGIVTGIGDTLGWRTKFF